MKGLDIRKLYGSHDEEIWTIERIYRSKTKTEDFRYKTHTQLSIHTYTSNGSEKKFLWREYGITWVVKEMKPCEYTLREWAIQLLDSCGCKLDCYKDRNCLSNNGYKDACEDLERYKADNKCTFPFPVWVIAAELQSIGNEQPEPIITHKRYQVVYDFGCSDGVNEFDNFEDAKDDAINTLVEWICDEQYTWEVDKDGVPHPTDEQIDSWDIMINECCIYVREWKEDEQTYYDEKMNYWFPSYEEENDINWLEWEALKKKHNW